MKKLLIFVLIITLATILYGCGNKENDINKNIDLSITLNDGRKFFFEYNPVVNKSHLENKCSNN